MSDSNMILSQPCNAARLLNSWSGNKSLCVLMWQACAARLAEDGVMTIKSSAAGSDSADRAGLAQARRNVIVNDNT